MVIFILAMTGKVADAARSGPKPRLDYLGAVMSAVGLGVIVLGTLQSSTWGWVVPKASPITPLGFSLTIWMIAGGAVLLWGFTVWQRHREKIGADPLVHMGLLRIPPLRAGLTGLFSQDQPDVGVAVGDLGADHRPSSALARCGQGSFGPGTGMSTKPPSRCDTPPQPTWRPLR